MRKLLADNQLSTCTPGSVYGKEYAVQQGAHASRVNSKAPFLSRGFALLLDALGGIMNTGDMDRTGQDRTGQRW